MPKVEPKLGLEGRKLDGREKMFQSEKWYDIWKAKGKDDGPEGLCPREQHLRAQGPHSRDPVHGLGAWIQVPRRKEKKRWNGRKY